MKRAFDAPSPFLRPQSPSFQGFPWLYAPFSTGSKAPLTLQMRPVDSRRGFHPYFTQAEANELNVVDRGDRFSACDAVEAAAAGKEERQHNGGAESDDHHDGNAE